MNSFYYYNPECNNILSVSQTDLTIQMRSPFNAGIAQRIYFETAEDPTKGVYLYVIINGNRKYFTIHELPNITLPDSQRCTLILEDKKTTDQERKLQNWIIEPFKFTGGYSMWYPVRTIRSYKGVFTDLNGTNGSNVFLYYDNSGLLTFKRISTISESEKKSGCMFLMDNRQFQLQSNYKIDRDIFVGVSDNNNLQTTNLNNVYWRIEPVDYSYHFWGGKYYLIFPDRVIPSTSNSDNKLYYDGSNVTLNTSNDAEILRKSQWEFIYIFDANCCLIKNVASGKIMIVDASNNLSMADLYDASEAKLNSDENKRKRWNITNANSVNDITYK